MVKVKHILICKYFYNSLYIYAYIYASYIYYIYQKEIKIMKNHEIYNKKINI